MEPEKSLEITLAQPLGIKCEQSQASDVGGDVPKVTCFPQSQYIAFLITVPKRSLNHVTPLKNYLRKVGECLSSECLVWSTYKNLILSCLSVCPSFHLSVHPCIHGIQQYRGVDMGI